MSREKIAFNNVIEDISKQVDLSGVVYMKQGDEVIAEAAYGYANRAEKLVNTVNTRFGIASGCKLFTAIGICQLVEKGRIAFDTPLKDCLDIDFPQFDENITVHHLLTHTSGIPDYYDEEVIDDFEDLWKDHPVYQMTTLKDFLPLFQTNPMMFQPGERFHYNNTGFIVLGLIIEQQTGVSFTDYIESEVFQKCGMRDSGYFSMDQLPQNTALGYIDNPEEGTWRTNIFSVPSRGGADGGAFVTAPDMIKLWEALLDNKLIGEAITRSLLHPHVIVEGEVHYGYGIWINKKKDAIFKYHVMGYDPGVNFRSSVYPDHDIKLVVPSNKESGAFEVTKAIDSNLLHERE